MTERLASILGKMENSFSQVVNSCQTLSIWEQIVDERIKKNTEAVKVRNRVLYVSASSSTWAQELTFLKKEIITKFNEKAGTAAICDIRFKGGF